jgi:hypothetical protein
MSVSIDVSRLHSAGFVDLPRLLRPKRRPDLVEEGGGGGVCEKWRD